MLSNFVPEERPADGGASQGSAGSPQIRLAAHGYPDGGATLAGTNRPNPRDISNEVYLQLDADGDPISMPNSGGFSSLLWVWGQFLDHDLTQTANGPTFGAAPIAAPTDDPVFAPGSPLPFSRSKFLSGTGTNASNPRQYVNEITAFIDGSNLYGSNATKLEALREPGTGKLRLSADGTIGFTTDSPIFGDGAVTGDARANENVALLSMHALFAREHNRVVDELAALDPGLTAQQLFDGARARVEAVMQAITYNEFLPILIGEGAIEDYQGFRTNVNPAISLEFSTAIYRFGHSLLSPTITRMNEDGSTHAAGNLALRDAFQRTGVVEQTGIGAILRGMSTTMSQEFDTFMIEDVRSLLFGAGGPGLDLAALSIQRGRDHGLPSYNGMRVALGFEARTSFDQVTDDAAVAARLSAAYGGDISGLDLLVGGLAEDSVGGGMMGETFRAVMIDQFTRLRDGDRFWSEARGFGDDELAELWDTTLADVMLRNTDVAELQNNAFLAFARHAGGAGPDTLSGGAGRNLLIGGDGGDTLVGGSREDHLDGGGGADALSGAKGSDVLEGGRRGDILKGGRGADDLHGERGGDDLSGGRGRDDLYGESGRDTMKGGRGADELNGGGGRDELNGDGGADAFVFIAGGRSGDDRIMDFDAFGDDVVRLSGFTFGSADPDDLGDRARLRAIEDATTFGKSGATIDLDELGGDGEIRLAGVDDLSFRGGEDFLFD